MAWMKHQGTECIREKRGWGPTPGACKIWRPGSKGGTRGRLRRNDPRGKGRTEPVGNTGDQKGFQGGEPVVSNAAEGLRKTRADRTWAGFPRTVQVGTDGWRPNQVPATGHPSHWSRKRHSYKLEKS